MKNKHSGSFRKNQIKWQEQKKRICPNCQMNFIHDPDENLCEDCADEVCDDIIEQMENEDEGEQV